MAIIRRSRSSWTNGFRSGMTHEQRPTAASPLAGQNVPAVRRRHDVATSQVLIGRVTDHPTNEPDFQNLPLALGPQILSTSLLALGPPGVGKTYSIARPIVESLCLASQAGRASVLVIDVKNDDFDWPGWFDVTVDMAHPDRSHGFDLFGGAATPHVAADRLASALLPAGVSADKQYFSDAATNALYWAVAAFHAAHERYPRLDQLLDVLSGQPRAVQSLRDKLRSREAKGGQAEEGLRLLEARTAQLARREDPAASLLERLRLLDRPNLRLLLDQRRPRFSMTQINQPLRVRIALDEGELPEASRIIARLAIAQYVQTVSSAQTNRDIFKGLIVDEAGRFVDDYVARGLQRVRSNNAGLVLLTQTLSDFPPELISTIMGSIGCKVAFALSDPQDAAYLAEHWGTHKVPDFSYTLSGGTTRGREVRILLPGRRTEGESTTRSVSTRYVEEYRWSTSALINEIPTGHAVVELSSRDGRRTPPLLVNLRLAAASDGGPPPPTTTAVNTP